MPVSESRKNANVKWDKENMTTLSCRVTKKKAEEFKVACRKLDTVPNRVLMKAINDTIEEAEGA